MCLRVREATLPTILGKVATKYSESTRKLARSMDTNCQKFSDHSKRTKATVGKQEAFPMYSRQKSRNRSQLWRAAINLFLRDSINSLKWVKNPRNTNWYSFTVVISYHDQKQCSGKGGSWQSREVSGRRFQMVLDRILAFGFVEASDLFKHSKAQRWARNKLPFLYSPGLGMVLLTMDWSFLCQLTIKKCPIDNAPTG